MNWTTSTLIYVLRCILIFIIDPDYFSQISGNNESVGLSLPPSPQADFGKLGTSGSKWRLRSHSCLGASGPQQ
jgi:hypothetical protein